MRLALRNSSKSSDVVDWRDRVGICLSSLCLAHCLLTPVVVAIVPMGNLIGVWDQGFHRLFFALVSLAALLAFLPGWRAHRDRRVPGWAFAGIVLLAIGASGLMPGHFHDESGDGVYWVRLLPTLFGGLAMIRAHWLNRKLCSCCAHGHGH